MFFQTSDLVYSDVPPTGVARFLSLLERMFWLLVSCLPLGLAVILSWHTFFFSTSADSEKYFQLPLDHKLFSLLVFVGAILLLWICYKRHLLPVLAAFAALARLGFMVLFLNNLAPFADAERVWLIASHQNLDSLAYNSYFPEWSNWTALQRLAVDLLHIDQNFLFIWQSIACVLSAAAIYFLVRKVYSRPSLPWLCFCIYLLIPSQFIYSVSYLAPDHTATCLILWGTYFLLFLFERSFRLKNVFFVFLGSVLIGLGNSFKPVGLITIVALIIAVVFRIIRDKSVSYALRCVVAIVLAVVCIALIPTAVRTMSEKILNTRIDSSATMHYLCVGLNTEGEGQIHIGSKSRTYATLRSNGYSAEQAKEETLHMLVQDWKEHWREVPHLFAEKLTWAWRDDGVPVYYFVNSSLHAESLSRMQAAVFSSIRQYGGSFSQIGYAFLMSFALLASVRTFLRGNKNTGHFLFGLLIFGFFCLLLLSEAQSRYKSNIMPYLSIFAAMGFETVFQKMP